MSASAAIDGWPPPPRAAAPLNLVQDLVNTWFGHLAGGGDELLATPADLARWCRAHGSDVRDRDVTESDLDAARAVREGLRAVLATHNDSTLPGDELALQRLDEVAESLAVHVRWTGGPHLASDAGGARGLLALTAAAPLVADGRDWLRLKVCREPRCRTAYVDTSKNGSKVWCSMAACGAANKQRAFIERRRASAARSTS